MNREQAETLLAQLIFDELDEPTRADLLAYLETDAELREQLGDMRVTAKLLREGAAAVEGEPKLSDRRRAHLVRRYERDAARSGPRSRRDRPVVVYRFTRYAAAAVIMLAIFVTALMLPAFSKVRQEFVLSGQYDGVAPQTNAPATPDEPAAGSYDWAGAAHDGRHTQRKPDPQPERWTDGKASHSGFDDGLAADNWRIGQADRTGGSNQRLSYAEGRPRANSGYFARDLDDDNAPTNWEATGLSAGTDRDDLRSATANGDTTVAAGPGSDLGGLGSFGSDGDESGNGLANGTGQLTYASKEQTRYESANRAGDDLAIVANEGGEWKATPGLGDVPVSGRLFAGDKQAAPRGTSEVVVPSDGERASGVDFAKQPTLTTLRPVDPKPEPEPIADPGKLGLDAKYDRDALDDTEAVREREALNVNSLTESGAGSEGTIVVGGELAIEGLTSKTATDRPRGEVGGKDLNAGLGKIRADVYHRAKNESDEELAKALSVIVNDVDKDAPDAAPTEEAEQPSTPPPAAEPTGNVTDDYHGWAKDAAEKLKRGDLEAAQKAIEHSETLVAESRVNLDRAQWHELRRTQDELERRLDEVQKARQSVSKLAEQQQRIDTNGQVAGGSGGGGRFEDDLRRQAEDQADAGANANAAELPLASHFKEYPVNGWELASEDNQSTFALDTDTGSYRLSARYIKSGFLPPRGAVRMEEFVNAFDYNYDRTADQTFTINVDAAPNPFAREGTKTVLLKIGVQGKVIGREGRKPAHLVYVVDASGSMDRKDRLPVAQYALTNLNGQLQAGDNVSLVTYGEKAEVQVENETVAHVADVNERINNIQTTGSTNLIEGVTAGYQVAARHYRPDQVNRVILLSDGAANIGADDARAILSKVDDFRRQGIQLTTAGVGLGGYNDELLEQLANNGDGNYLFLDSPDEARRQFVDNMNANLQTIARDAKIQVEFDPARVRRYRLIGYENRDIADTDFRNDAIDAGEVGSGQSATAVYELELIGPARCGADVPPIGTVYVRYRNADTNKVEEIDRLIGNDAVRDTPVESRPRFYLAAAAAQFAELLRESPNAAGGDLDDVLRVAEKVSAQLPLDKRIAELRDLVREARNLDRAP